MSPKTADAYGGTSRQFLVCLAEDRGGAPSLRELALTPADVRGFMADRRGEGAGGRSLMREIAGLRSLARFLERTGRARPRSRRLRPPK